MSPLPIDGATTQNTSSTEEPSVVTFAQAMSTFAFSNTRVSTASNPVLSVARISTSN